MGCGASLDSIEVEKTNQQRGKQQHKRRYASEKVSWNQWPEIRRQKQNGFLSLKLNQNKKTAIYLFGESPLGRKIVQFSLFPDLYIETILSRSNEPVQTKYLPDEVILEESQQNYPSLMYISTSHPPYNQMFCTFLQSNLIFLCGGINFKENNVSNEAFLFKTDDKNVGNVIYEQIREKEERRRMVGSNLMGQKFMRLSLMKEQKYSHMGVHVKSETGSYVYVMGGKKGSEEFLKSCERYSVSSNIWQRVSDLNIPRANGLSLVMNSKIYIFGGLSSKRKRSKKIERYDEKQKKWEILKFKIDKGVSDALLFPCFQSNEVLLLGGSVQFGSLNSVIRIDFENETYCWDSNMMRERSKAKGVFSHSQNLGLVFGGDHDDTIEKYSFTSNSWVLMSKTNYGAWVSPEDIDAFSFAQPTISLSPKAHQQCEERSQFSAHSKIIFGSDDYPSIFQLNPQDWSMRKKNVPMGLRLRSSMSASYLKDGQVFIAGGIDCYEERTSKSSFLYNPLTNKAEETRKMLTRKYQFASCAVETMVYTFGGMAEKTGSVLNQCEKFDIDKNQWTRLIKMPRKRTQCHALAIKENKSLKILIIGGHSPTFQEISEIDIFDTSSQSFSTFPVKLPKFIEISHAFLKDEDGTAKQVHTFFLFGYNQEDSQHLCLEVQICLEKKSCEIVHQSKLKPFHLVFKVEEEEKIMFFFICEKEIRKWEYTNNQLSIVMLTNNQIFSMPLGRFKLI